MFEEEEPTRSWNSVSKETLAIYRHADKAYAAFSCPATSECCQLTQRQRQPWLWPSEWRLLEEKAQELWGKLPEARLDGGCPFLDEDGKRCRVYNVRPLGCRTFFCHRREGPKNEPMAEMVSLSKRLEFINVQWEPEITTPLEILEWHRRASGGQ